MPADHIQALQRATATARGLAAIALDDGARRHWNREADRLLGMLEIFTGRGQVSKIPARAVATTSRRFAGFRG